MLKVFFVVENSKPSHKTCTLIIKLQKNPKNKKTYPKFIQSFEPRLYIFFNFPNWTYIKFIIIITIILRLFVTKIGPPTLNKIETENYIGSWKRF
jgi:hypothetical protein